jgi:hypothetical protein
MNRPHLAPILVLALGGLTCDRDTRGPTGGDAGASDSGGSTRDAGSGGGRECTFPADPSDCGCGNACADSSGLCETCGSRGSGCTRTEIWCCADSDCPSGTYCSTLSSSASVGYHLCLPSAEFDECTTSSDCFDPDECVSGLCRETE